jgi:hypothetical protein
MPSELGSSIGRFGLIAAGGYSAQSGIVWYVPVSGDLPHQARFTDGKIRMVNGTSVITRSAEDGTIDDIGDVVITAAAPGQMLRFNGASWVNEDSPYDVGMFIPGIHGNGALMAQLVLTRSVSFPDDFAGARAYAGVTATAETVLDVHRNGSPIGTITFGTGASAGTFATAGGGAETFAAGDRLAIINEDPADATLADLSITFLGKRT